MIRKNKNLRSIKSYRLSPTLALSVRMSAIKHNLNESAFVRMVLMDAVKNFD